MNRLAYCALSLNLLLPFAPLQASNLAHFPTGLAAWTIDVSKSQINPSAPAAWAGSIIKVEVTQSDEVRRDLVSYSDGKSRENWGIPGSNIILMEAPNGVAFLTPPSRYFSIPFPPSIFDWLSPGLLQEKTPVDYQGKRCFHYRGTETFSDIQGLKVVTVTVPCEAWIESKTLFPVALDDGQSFASFTFLPPPKTSPVLPAKFKQILAGYKANMGMPLTPPAPN